MRATFFLAALVNFGCAALTGGIANLTVGVSMLAVGAMWNSGDEDE